MMANLITGCRIFCSLLLLRCPVFSARFFALYLFCGFTDMIDGAVARKTNTAGSFGSKLDTAADLVFTGVCLYKLLPALPIPVWLAFWTAAIAVIKLSSIAWSWIYRRQLAAEHTLLNKITGFLLFLLPFTHGFAAFTPSAAVVCFAATLAAIQEGYLIHKAI